MDLLGQSKGTTPEEIAAYLRRANQPNLPQRAKDMTAGVAALPYRLAGTPVDIATMMARPFGYSTPDADIVGSSEYLLAKAKGAGLHPGVPQNAQGLFGDLAGQVLTPGAGPTEAKVAASLLGGGAILDAGNMTARTVSAYSAPAAMRVPRSQQGIFAGFEAAKDPPMRGKETAEAMAEGLGLYRMEPGSAEWHAANRQIHAATGAQDPKQATHFGLDGHPRWEIDDSEMRMAGEDAAARRWAEHDLLNARGNGDLMPAVQKYHDSVMARPTLRGPDSWGPLDQYVDHPEFFKQYPDARRNDFEWSDRKDTKVSGSHAADPVRPRMTLSAALNLPNGGYSTGPRSVTAHELNHDVQMREGFESGGSSRDYPNAANPDLEYARISGEAEARATQERLHLNQRERAARYPFLDYKLPEADVTQLGRPTVNWNKQQPVPMSAGWWNPSPYLRAVPPKRPKGIFDD